MLSHRKIVFEKENQKGEDMKVGRRHIRVCLRGVGMGSWGGHDQCKHV